MLGGGVVKGSLVLIGGDPGIGKSTLLLQVSAQLSGSTRHVLYISGEESVKQTKLRADRLGINNPSLHVLSETDMEYISSAIEEMNPAFVVVDSIQTVYQSDITSAPGSVSQVKRMYSRADENCKDKRYSDIYCRSRNKRRIHRGAETSGAYG